MQTSIILFCLTFSKILPAYILIKILSVTFKISIICILEVYHGKTSSTQNFTVIWLFLYIPTQGHITPENLAAYFGT